MRADTASLTELGLLPDASGAWPLASWLDTTHSPAGHQALKTLIAAPLGTVEEIRARQQLLPHLLRLTNEVPWADWLQQAVQVENYLSSNYVLVPVTFAERALFAWRFRDIVAYVKVQLRAVDALLTLSELVYGRIRSLPGDALFVAARDAFDAAVNHPHRSVLRSAVARGGDVTALDSVVRNVKTIDANTPYGMPQRTVSLRAALQALIAALALLDALCSLASASAAIAGALPTVVPHASGALAFDGLHHPLLPNGVANSVALATDERVVFLTGPNMAGKSTLLRAIGIAVHCAHLGMATSARRACIPLYDQLLVSITVRDNLRRGESLYLAEVRRVRTIVEAVDRGDAVLALCDEVFRGTNIKDATQATGLLVDGLARAPSGTFVIASHLAEVAEARTTSAGVGCWCMEVESTGVPTFSYRVGRGVSDVHLGMVLLDAEGVGPMLRRMATQ